MAWTPAQVLAWLAEVEPRADARTHFEWLELAPTAAPAAIQAAYHAIARTRHPDLYRRTLGPRDHDRLVRMYARVSGAYAELRAPAAAAAYLQRLTGSAPRPAAPARPAAPPLRRASPTAPPPTAPPLRRASPTAPPPTAPSSRRASPTAPPPTAAPRPGAAPIDPARAMNPRALALYRRAERSLGGGNRAAATLELKMAIAADPASAFLRAALAELDKG